MTERLDVRPASSLPMDDADKRLDNFNWTKGLQSQADWTWSGNLNPVAFPNNLARYFLHIPGVFEQQLNYSTTLIFDEPSFRNGVQVSGFLPRVTRELVISLIAQFRRCRYSTTHHAVLGTLTARKHDLNPTEIGDKWGHLLGGDWPEAIYTPLERAALKFTSCFITDPKSYSDRDFSELRKALVETNSRVYSQESGWLVRIRAARGALSLALAAGKSLDEAHDAARNAANDVLDVMPQEENELKVNAQVVELAFLALQFVALTGVFSSLNIPDEDFLRGVFEAVVPEPVRSVIDTILKGTTVGMPSFVPPLVEPPAKEIASGQVRVEPSLPRGTRVPLISWERDPSQGTRDKGLALGGIHVGVYGWSFGSYFPGSLTYALMHHGELARFEAPYSLPLLFNEDEWRNGTQTAGFNRPVTRELLIQKVYHLIRSRYGLEHHTMFFFNAVLQYYGVGQFRLPGLTDEQHAQALTTAIRHAEQMVLNLDQPRGAPTDVFSELQLALLDWVEAFVTSPHAAHNFEPTLRATLTESNCREISAGVRRLDTASGETKDSALKRLADHQIAELAMMAGHMDGLGRFLTILQLESELPVSAVQLNFDESNSIQVGLTGSMNNRPGLFDALKFSHVPETVFTYNELLVNAAATKRVRDYLGHSPRGKINIATQEVQKTAEF